ncbi:MAG TPA: D-glycerate dehydrogenase [Acidimicrobiales bacterium]|nr:D-glycerate dehydrogenase [Acidimicrobiales bacterium]
MGRVLVTRQLPPGGCDPLLAAGHEVVRRDNDDPYTTEELVELVPGFDGLVCLLTDRIDAAVLRAGAGGRLRVVANVAVGFDNIDTVTAADLAIAIRNTPDVLSGTTADLAFLLILGAARLASEAESELRSGRWTGWSLTHNLGVDVHGALLGLLGYGRIGREVARRATGFGMEVLHHSRHDTGLPGYVPTMDELLRSVDILSIHVPLTDATHHLIGARELSLMKSTAVVVNTARGPVIDESALIRALHAGTIFAAGLDVYENEPHVRADLIAAPRTMLLPHIGSATSRTRLRMARLACQGVCDVLGAPDHQSG